MKTHLDGAGVVFDINDISYYDLLLQDRLVDTRIQSKLFCSFDSFEPNNNM